LASVASDTSSGAIIQFEKASTIAKLLASARKRKREQTV
jgi:hypothetical protein